MKYINKKVFFIGLGLAFILLFTIFCSDSIKQDTEKSKTQVETLIHETTKKTFSKTICTDCHNVDDKGDLKFRDKDNKFELKQ